MNAPGLKLSYGSDNKAACPFFYFSFGNLTAMAVGLKQNIEGTQESCQSYFDKQRHTMRS